MQYLRSCLVYLLVSQFNSAHTQHSDLEKRQPQTSPPPVAEPTLYAIIRLFDIVGWYTEVTVDGQPLRLRIDTGRPHTWALSNLASEEPAEGSTDQPSAFTTDPTLYPGRSCLRPTNPQAFCQAETTTTGGSGTFQSAKANLMVSAGGSEAEIDVNAAYGHAGNFEFVDYDGVFGLGPHSGGWMQAAHGDSNEQFVCVIDLGSMDVSFGALLDEEADAFQWYESQLPALSDRWLLPETDVGPAVLDTLSTTITIRANDEGYESYLELLEEQTDGYWLNNDQLFIACHAVIPDWTFSTNDDAEIIYTVPGRSLRGFEIAG